MTEPATEGQPQQNAESQLYIEGEHSAVKPTDATQQRLLCKNNSKPGQMHGAAPPE